MTREFELMAENAELRHQLSELRGDHLTAWGNYKMCRVQIGNAVVPVDTYMDGYPLRLFINGEWIAVSEFGDEFREILTAKIAAMKEAA
jgi:hypothetical protein